MDLVPTDLAMRVLNRSAGVECAIERARAESVRAFGKAAE